MFTTYQRGKNKELEARCNDTEKKYLEEKTAREEADTKIKCFKKHLIELREREEHHQQQEIQKNQSSSPTSIEASEKQINIGAGVCADASNGSCEKHHMSEKPGVILHGSANTHNLSNGIE